MCGIAGIIGDFVSRSNLESMNFTQLHRGPDDQGLFLSPSGKAGLAHSRLSIIDLSHAGHQPMSNHDGSLWIVYNGEIYNHIELRKELDDYKYRSSSDTEIILAAYERWGVSCLGHFIGMFSFAIWDENKSELFAARDRFGVKPFHYTFHNNFFVFSSEEKSLFSVGVQRADDTKSWATYLSSGIYDHSERTFWSGVSRLLPGHALIYSQQSGLKTWQWYSLADQINEHETDERLDEEVAEELKGLLEDTIRLRFRSDVPVGICLSGGFDSSLLLGLIRKLQISTNSLKTFTFYCNDDRYDEIPWVKEMLEHTPTEAYFCELKSSEVPDLAARMLHFQDEPYGGLPTLGMAKVFECAKVQGVPVLLDGNGLDEGWAGYDYYRETTFNAPRIAPIQGSVKSIPHSCLVRDFEMQEEIVYSEFTVANALQKDQLRDITQTKIPRAMRFIDRASMMFSREVREPFLDHRIIELGLRQPVRRKVQNSIGKWLPRMVGQTIIPDGVREAPKRPVQTPQREWLRNDLARWANDCIEQALVKHGGSWLDSESVRREWQNYRNGQYDNSFFVWKWISLGLS